jgi:nucleotide-binding universal stress UspA family protein
MKKILIVMDLHPSEKKVIETGYSLAKEMKASVVLLYVKLDLVNYTLTYKKVGALKPFNLENFEVAAKDFLEKSKQKVLDDMIQTVVKQGHFAESILNAAKEMKIDVIVMGSHNTSWLEEIVIGRVTNDDLQQTEIPILIVPTRRNDKTNTIISLES